MADYKLTLVTQERKIFEGDITSLVMPGAEGYFGVLANHAPLIAVLDKGTVTVEKGGRKIEFMISGGFFEMNKNIANILADTIDPKDLSIAF